MEPSQSNSIPSRFQRLAVVWRLLQKGPITAGEVRREGLNEKPKLKNVTAKALEDDIEVLRATFKMDIKAVRDTEKEDFTYFLVGGIHAPATPVSTKTVRQQLYQEEKKKIASLVGGLLFGRDSYKSIEIKNADDLSMQGPVMPLPKAEIWKLLNAGAIGAAKKKVLHIQQQLEEIVYVRSMYMLAVDAGTTTETFCSSILQYLSIPFEHLARLIVCTNSRGIFNILGEPGVSVKTLILGGMQQKKSEALSGVYAHKSLCGMDLRFLVSIIGVTAVDIGRGTFFADHEQDAAIKNEFLQRTSALRVVICDSSKFVDSSGLDHIPLCSINPISVDVIVTDKIPKGKLKVIASYGVAVLAGEIV
jgi:DeoR/GlpR family transcriptional regulator of sugar metabolism